MGWASFWANFFHFIIWSPWPRVTSVVFCQCYRDHTSDASNLRPAVNEASSKKELTQFVAGNNKN
jgi:hypothetical protein